MAGCDSSDSSEVNDGTKEQDELQAGIQTIGKAQRIEVRSDSDDNDSVLRSITDKADIEIFIEQLKMNEWEYAPALPEEAKKKYEYIILQEDTTKLGEKEDKDASLHEAARIISYENSPYVTLKVALIKITMKIPDEAAEYINQ
ncbi:hypothetical protein J6TS1_24720 [Siminovitchia terrae]|uniref:Uncharacterized protein n=1 Tax=Siminovitchia terrae TaxID=1914933 RepID=A0ABQ4KX48_SIMTE|nr:hypothetical protein [Siminovitchia terrae]GIN96602.1 hypothetical protein J6TS1_24720 [Siminovitchia terrae]